MLRHWLALGFGAAGVAVALAGGYEWATRPATYHEAVLEALDGRHVAYTGVDVREVCLPDPSCTISDGTRTFATVVVHRDIASYGQITCYDRRGDCYLDLVALEVRRAPLCDLRGVRFAPRQVIYEIARIVGWLRAAAQRYQSSIVSEPSSG
ncbi:MAG TPA: hypothetical protein VKE41_01310 [Roseiflexaceae bacterium]|nr:hypothetical protein [Roseiflexaceae bacterium]